MSKYLGIISNGSGKLGNVVLQRNNVQRARVRTIANPKTKGQAIARMIAATATRSYGAMKGIVDHSFAGIAYGGKSMNYFVKNAMRDLRNGAIALTDDPTADVDFYYSPKTAGGVVPAAFLISNGSLPTIVTAYSKTVEGTPAPFFKTAGTFSPASMAQTGLQAGDQLTFCLITCEDYPRFLYRRVILKPDADMTAAAFTAAMFEPESDQTIVTALVGLSAAADVNVSSFFQETIAQCFAAVITSRLVDGVWQRSTERLAWIGDQDAADFSAYVYEPALRTWMDGGTSLAESDRYLNEG